MSKAFSSSQAPNTHILLSTLSINSSVSFFLLLGKRKKRTPGGKRSQMPAHLFIPLLDLGPKIFHCSVNSPKPSSICPVVFISSYPQKKGWILLPVCDRLHAKITQILHPSLYIHTHTHTHTHTLFVNYKHALL